MCNTVYSWKCRLGVNSACKISLPQQVSVVHVCTTSSFSLFLYLLHLTPLSLLIFEPFFSPDLISLLWHLKAEIESPVFSPTYAYDKEWST